MLLQAKVSPRYLSSPPNKEKLLNFPGSIFSKTCPPCRKTGKKLWLIVFNKIGPGPINHALKQREVLLNKNHPSIDARTFQILEHAI